MLNDDKNYVSDYQCDIGIDGNATICDDNEDGQDPKNDWGDYGDHDYKIVIVRLDQFKRGIIMMLIG